jgi:hypothetical protein
MMSVEGMTKAEESRDEFEERFWNERVEFVVREEVREANVYDLEERTARFGEMVIAFAKSIPPNPVTTRIVTQLVGAGTSSEQTTSKQMTRARKKNPSRASALAGKKRGKRNTSCAWLFERFQS